MAGETVISVIEKKGTDKQTVQDIVTPGYLLLYFVGDKIEMKGNVKLEALKPLLIPLIAKLVSS